MFLGMGIIFSRPRNYVARKVNDCKLAIIKKIDDAKLAAINKVHSSVQSVKQCLVTTKDDIVGSILDVKNNVCGRINRIVQCVCNACRSVRDNILGKITYCRDTVVGAKNAVVNKVVTTKNNICDCCTNTKNYISDTYTHNKNAIKQKYSDIRNAKLTKKQKLNYFLKGLVVLWILYVVMATSFDLYVGDVTSAEERFCTIRDNIASVLFYTFTYTKIFLIYTFMGLRHTVIFIWKYTKLISLQTYKYSTEFKVFCYTTSKEAIHYVLGVFRVTFEFIAFYVIELFTYVWLGTCYVSDHIYQLLLTLSEHLVYYSKEGWEVFKEESKVSYKHTKNGLSYAYIHGSVFLEDVTTRGSKYLYYLLTDFKHASVDGVVWSYYTAKDLIHASGHAMSQGSSLAYDYSRYLITQSRNFLSFSIAWLYTSSLTLFGTISNACSFSYNIFIEWLERAYFGLKYSSNNTYEALIYLGEYSYDKVYLFGANLLHCVMSFNDFIVNSSILFYENFVSFMNEYGFEWLHRLKNFICNVTLILFRALSKFFSDLVSLFYKFITVTSDRIFNVVYFFFFIIFKLFQTLAISFKFIVSNLVVVLKVLFASIVWCMKFVIIAYSTFLSSYNNYRESIFFSILTLVSIYCTSVVKSRKISEQIFMQELGLNDEYEDSPPKEAKNIFALKSASQLKDQQKINETESYTAAKNIDGSLDSSHADVDFDSSFDEDNGSINRDLIQT